MPRPSGPQIPVMTVHCWKAKRRRAFDGQHAANDRTDVAKPAANVASEDAMALARLPLIGRKQGADDASPDGSSVAPPSPMMRAKADFMHWASLHTPRPETPGPKDQGSGPSSASAAHGGVA
ncbi:hypothetical protein FQR65_LT18923 [Abscondita terminalis]|nr:hypothetical protein FQR65_LT18923 [Abscondita terminalis]